MTTETKPCKTASTRKLLNSLTDLVFPPLCPLCRISKELVRGNLTKPQNNLVKNNGICVECNRELTAITIPLCSVCGEPFPSGDSDTHSCGACLKSRPHYTRARSAYAYDGRLKKAIQHFKYNKNTLLARTLAALTMNATCGLDEVFDTVVPVPLHKNRLRKRGFNQSILLAKELVRLWPDSHSPKLDYQNLRRLRDTKSQIELKEDERTANVKDAFSIGNKDAFKGKKVLLIDDVYTTGATIRECSKILKESGAEVFALTLARAVRV